MGKYRCTICGYIYDETIEKIKFDDLSDDWVCPLCAASKDLFEEIAGYNNKQQIVENSDLEHEELRQLTDYEISLICSNLARGCEKQYLDEERSLFSELAKYYESRAENQEGTLSVLKNKLVEDIREFNTAMDIADKYHDRGAKRIITWANKTSNILKMIIDNYQKKGLDYIKNTKIWVCDICGFVFIGDIPPEICPICKVPNFKILEVK